MKITILNLTLISFTFSFAQVFTFNTNKDGKIVNHRIMIDQNYLVETQFISEPPEFISTRGGFFNQIGKTYILDLEFNSNFKNDSLRILELEKIKSWKKVSKNPIDLNGKWLMAGRVTDKGEKRRDVSKPRKTMKFLKDGYFQWIAFNTETLQFFGSGGGFYNAQDGIYKENIEFFSRNNKSVGRVLPFKYNVKGRDWHHQGKSSKGVPMYEIWTKRID